MFEGLVLEKFGFQGLGLGLALKFEDSAGVGDEIDLVCGGGSKVPSYSAADRMRNPGG